MIPARALLEQMGYTVNWDGKSQTVTAQHPSGELLKLKIGGLLTVGKAGYEQVSLGPSAYVQDNRIWIPLEAVGLLQAVTFQYTEDRVIAFSRAEDRSTHYRLMIRSDEEPGSEKLSKLGAELDKALGGKVMLSAVTAENYNQKVNLMIAAGDPAELMQIYNTDRYNDELLASFASDLSGLLAGYPALQALVADNPQAVRQNGTAVYGIPIPTNRQQAPFPALRADWLNILGLNQPTTLEEFRQVLDKFVHYDPDGNGRDDTIGLTGSINGNGLGTFSWVEQAFTGSPERFALVDGKVVDTAVTEGQTKALKWLADSYAAGLIDKEFAVMTPGQVTEKLKRSQTGAAALTLEQAADLTLDIQVPNSNRLDQWVPVSLLRADGQAAPIAPWNTTDEGMYIISRTVEPAKAKQLLCLLESWVAGGGRLTPESAAELAPLLGSPDLLPAAVVNGSSMPERLQEDYRKAVASWSGITYTSQYLANSDVLFSTGKYAELNSRLNQLKIKVIMGAASLKDWDTYVAKMQQSSEYKAMMTDLQKLASSH